MKAQIQPKFNPEDVRTPIWERISLPGVIEPISHFRAFEIWRNLGADDRKFATIAVAANTGAATVARWAVQWRWRERAQAFDNYMHLATKARLERKISEEATIWLEREHAARNRWYEMAQALYGRAIEQLQHPTTLVVKEMVSEDGKTIVQYIQPNKWTDATLKGIIELAQSLESASIGIAPGSRMIDAIDMDSLPLHVLDAIAEGRQVDLRPYMNAQKKELPEYTEPDDGAPVGDGSDGDTDTGQTADIGPAGTGGIDAGDGS